MSSAQAAAAEPPVARKAGMGVLTAACVSALVVNANTSAVTILLPAISEDTGAPVAQLQWAVTGYMIVGAAGILLLALMKRYKAGRPRAVDLAAAAAVTTHTIPVPQEA